MKRTSIVLVLVFIALACDRSKEALTPNIESPSLTEAKTKFSPYDTNELGEFVYKHLYNHIQTVDPYSYLPEEKRSAFKLRMDEVKTFTEGIPFNHEKLWQEAYRTGGMTASLRDELITMSKRLQGFSQSYSSKASIDTWFNAQRGAIADKKNLSYEDKRFLIRQLIVVQYSLKAFVDSYEPAANFNDQARTARTEAVCIIQIIDCVISNGFAYAGYGAKFDPVTGTVIGAAVGILVSIATCECSNASNSTDCKYPTFISTPDVCYNSTNGINFYVAGLGKNTAQVEWEIYSSDNLSEANLLRRYVSATNKIHLTDSDLSGYSTIWVRATGLCNGGDWPTMPIRFIITDLGRPEVYVSGPTTVQVNPNSWVWYTLTGRNLSNYTWGFATFGVGSGEIMQSGSTGAWVRWLSSGYIRLTVTATTPCGSAYGGPYVQINN